MQEQHETQMMILRELLFNPKMRFTDLNISGLTSDHFSYHVRTLIKEGYICKAGVGYILTGKGKEFANRMDTEKLVTERQPKLTVIVIATKVSQRKKYFLMQTRQKEPFFGFRGFISGKIQFGETILDAAKRELHEETGLCAEFKYRYTLHEHIFDESGELLEDKFFYVTEASKPKGKLTSTQGGSNEWIAKKDILDQKKLFYDIADILRWFSEGEERFVEKEYKVNEF